MSDRLVRPGRARLRAALFFVLLALVLPLAACGGEDGGDGSEQTPTTASPADFPDPAGKTFEELRRELGPGPVLARSVSVLEAGRRKNRFGFGLFDVSRKQIAGAQAAIYVAPTKGGRVQGPFPARSESLQVKPQFQSRTSAADSYGAESVYVAEIPFKRPGTYRAMAAVKLDDRLVAADLAGPALQVMKDSSVPEVGEKAIRIDTPTEADVGGNLSAIDTRVPPTTMHSENFADVLGKKPIVLLFSTPGLCQSRVCGPVADITEQVKAEYGEKAAFIHMEIYNGNELERGWRPQVLAWHLQTEPWAFTIGKDGRVAARLEGAFSAAELEKAVQAALKRR